jgi:hypothetical protein
MHDRVRDRQIGLNLENVPSGRMQRQFAKPLIGTRSESLAQKQSTASRMNCWQQDFMIVSLDIAITIQFHRPVSTEWLQDGDGCSQE